jgi:hypothetical protein
MERTYAPTIRTEINPGGIVIGGIAFGFGAHTGSSLPASGAITTASRQMSRARDFSNSEIFGLVWKAFVPAVAFPSVLSH